MVILSTPSGMLIDTFETEGDALMYAAMNGISEFAITDMDK